MHEEPEEEDALGFPVDDTPCHPFVWVIGGMCLALIAIVTPRDNGPSNSTPACHAPEAAKLPAAR